ncbi:hypothetical protein Ciccas_001343 [Cichlidogyrus casuarinus]|uniref:Uncharacterized protein n=1 Tax=Cichlidogyrus casuarinus TaxID=1844966 RepID=A0ABD2QKK7_9PLAT
MLDLLPRVQKWRYISPMKKARSSFSVVTLDNCVYVFGGLFEQTSLKCVEKYDPHSNTWAQLPPMHCARENSTACVFNGRILVAGGRDRKTVEEFNPATNQWTFTTGNLTFERSGGAMTLVAGNLILGGGDKYDTIEFFNDEKRRWIMWPTWCTFLNVVPSHYVLTLG